MLNLSFRTQLSGRTSNGLLSWTQRFPPRDRLQSAGKLRSKDVTIIKAVAYSIPTLLLRTVPIWRAKALPSSPRPGLRVSAGQSRPPSRYSTQALANANTNKVWAIPYKSMKNSPPGLQNRSWWSVSSNSLRLIRLSVLRRQSRGAKLRPPQCVDSDSTLSTHRPRCRPPWPEYSLWCSSTYAQHAGPRPRSPTATFPRKPRHDGTPAP